MTFAHRKWGNLPDLNEMLKEVLQAEKNNNTSQKSGSTYRRVIKKE